MGVGGGEKEVVEEVGRRGGLFSGLLRGLICVSVNKAKSMLR